ncbi:MAG TPA: transglutaminase domain-containing protein [Candidatus Hydrogenedentes bacterium]|nr:transglutaminase domain-containing protein [Candidatus Hydrogenedentota bacterium]
MAACAVAVLTAMLLRAGAEVAQSEAPDPFVSFGSLNRAFAVLDESPEYIERFRSLDPGEDTAAIDGALAAIFPEGATRDEAGVLRILSYAAQAIRLEATTTPLGSEVLKQGHAYCNGIAIAFVALCRRAGLPARVNAFHNLEWMEGHNAAEVHYDGAWRFFDPTYGAFYYSTAAYDGAGRVLGLRELAANAGPRHGFQVTRRLWEGDFDGRVDVEPIDPEARYGDYPFTLVAFHERLFRSAFPIIHSDDAASSYPLDVDLRDTDSVWIGARDGAIMDQLGKAEGGRRPRFHGTPVIGKTRLGTAFQTVTMEVREPGRYRLTYHVAPGGRHDRMAAVELKSVTVIGARVEKDAWILECYVQASPAVLVVVNRYYFAAIDAVHVERIVDKADTETAE